LARMNADLGALVWGIPLLLLIVTMGLTWQQLGEDGTAVLGLLVFFLAVAVLYLLGVGVLHGTPNKYSSPWIEPSESHDQH